MSGAPGPRGSLTQPGQRAATRASSRGRWRAPAPTETHRAGAGVPERARGLHPPPGPGSWPTRAARPTARSSPTPPPSLGGRPPRPVHSGPRLSGDSAVVVRPRAGGSWRSGQGPSEPTGPSPGHSSTRPERAASHGAGHSGDSPSAPPTFVLARGSLFTKAWTNSSGPMCRSRSCREGAEWVQEGRYGEGVPCRGAPAPSPPQWGWRPCFRLSQSSRLPCRRQPLLARLMGVGSNATGREPGNWAPHEVTEVRLPLRGGGECWWPGAWHLGQNQTLALSLLLCDAGKSLHLSGP